MVDDFPSGGLEIASERAVGEMTVMKADAIPVLLLRANSPLELPPPSQQSGHTRQPAFIIKYVCQHHGR
jgi:hypothetical protein